MAEKRQIIVYGLGKQYQKRKEYLEKVYAIVGYSDKCKKDILNYVDPNDLHKEKYDCIYVTSNKYFDEIKEMLIHEYGIEEEKIIGEKETCYFLDNSLLRNEWVIKNLGMIPEGRTLLDAGAGEQPYKKYCSHLNYIGQDFGEYDKADKTAGLQHTSWDTSKVDIVSDIIDIPLDDLSVDAILCTEVFEHIKNPILALKEFGRLLKKDGVLLLTVPFCSLTHFAPYYYANGFSKYWYEDNLRDYGFEIEEIVANGNYFDYLRQELLRLPYIAKKYCNQLNQGDAYIESITRESLVLLKELSDQNEGSEEVLCFGYMVRARKK